MISFFWVPFAGAFAIGLLLVPVGMMALSNSWKKVGVIVWIISLLAVGVWWGLAEAKKQNPSLPIYLPEALWPGLSAEIAVLQPRSDKKTESSISSSPTTMLSTSSVSTTSTTSIPASTKRKPSVIKLKAETGMLYLTDADLERGVSYILKMTGGRIPQGKTDISVQVWERNTRFPGNFYLHPGYGEIRDLVVGYKLIIDPPPAPGSQYEFTLTRK